MSLNPPTIDIVSLIHRKKVWYRKMKDGSSLSHPLPGGNPWAQKSDDLFCLLSVLEAQKLQAGPPRTRRKQIEGGGELVVHRSDCYVHVHIFICPAGESRRTRR